jgi:hypothetical protein
VHRRTWKKGEQRIAAFFGTQRTSLSGGNSKITRSDTMHDTLFIEVKHHTSHPITDVWDRGKKATKGKKAPPLILLVDRHSGEDEVIPLVHSGDFSASPRGTPEKPPTAASYAGGFEIKAQKAPIAALNLYRETRELAKKEGKVPLVVLAVKSRPGFWMVFDAKDWGIIRQAVVEGAPDE